MSYRRSSQWPRHDDKSYNESLCSHNMVTGVTEGIRNGHEVTGGQEEIRYRPQMVTENQKEIPYCSSGISSGK